MNFFLCNFLDIFTLVRNQEQCQSAKLMLRLLKYKVFTSGYQQGLTLEYFFRMRCQNKNFKNWKREIEVHKIVMVLINSIMWYVFVMDSSSKQPLTPSQLDQGYLIKSFNECIQVNDVKLCVSWEEDRIMT